MRLGELCKGLMNIPAGCGELDVSEVVCDSRKAVEGSLFLAVPGETTDGFLFAREAVSNGAVAVIAPQGGCGETSLGVPVLEVKTSAVSWETSPTDSTANHRKSSRSLA